VGASLAIVLVVASTAVVVVSLLVRRRKAETLRPTASEPRLSAQASPKAESAVGLEPEPPGMAVSVQPTVLPEKPRPMGESAQGEPLTPVVPEDDADHLRLSEQPDRSSLGREEAPGAMPAPQPSPSSGEADTSPAPGEQSSSVVPDGHSVRRRIPPEKRGGRSRISEAQSAQTSPTAPRPGPAARPAVGPPRAELVCRWEGAGWVIGVEVIELDDSSLEWVPVIDGIPLEERSGFYQLPSLDSPVRLLSRSRVDSAEGPGPEVWSGDFSKELLVFKLDADAREGRRVHCPGRGLCLVVAPSDWKPLGRPGPVAPEPVLPDGTYTAHYFDLDAEDGHVAFRRPDGHESRLARHRLHVRLEGAVLPDSSARMGPFFGPTPPVLSAATPEVWDEVATIVVGEEGPGRKRWRTHFHPSPGSLSQEMPPELVSKGAGWFFVRFYSYTDDLIDSLDFRFASGLQLMHRPQVRLLPGTEGHEEVRFILSADGGWRVTPMWPRLCRADVDQSSSEIALVIPAAPEADETRWQVDPPGGRPVPLVIRLDRVWWSLVDDGEEPRWSDRPLRVLRDWFRPVSRKRLLLKLPRGLSVRLGFDASMAREFGPAGSDGQPLAVHLRDFADCPELSRPSPASFRVWVSRESAVCLSLPALTLRCRICDHPGTSRQDMVRHVGSHLEDLFPRLSWEEILEAFPDRGYPKALYRCSYCGHIEFDEQTISSDNPTSAILAHLDNCPYAERDGGKVVVRFEPIDDVERMREILPRLRQENLPDIRRCRFCPRDSEPWEDPSREAMTAHLMERHWDELWTYREE